METEMIKFNKKLYSKDSLKNAVGVYFNNPGRKLLPILREKKDYFELEIKTEHKRDNFKEEFCNYVLYLNFK